MKNESNVSYIRNCKIVRDFHDGREVRVHAPTGALIVRGSPIRNHSDGTCSMFVDLAIVPAGFVMPGGRFGDGSSSDDVATPSSGIVTVKGGNPHTPAVWSFTAVEIPEEFFAHNQQCVELDQPVTA